MSRNSFILGGFLITALSLSTVSSCTREAAEDNNGGSVTVAFTNAIMKPWFDTHCRSCHATGGSNARDWTYNPGNENSIQGNISQIYREVYVTKSMPPGGLSSAELSKFKTWYDAGHPSN